MFKLYKLFVLCVGLLLLGLAPVVLAQDSNTVQVSLTEFEIDMPDSVPAGPTTFEITNNGTVEHNFEVEGQDVEEELETNLQPGETGTLEVDLQPGTYEIYCPVDDHEGQGMSLTLTVTEAETDSDTAVTGTEAQTETVTSTEAETDTTEADVTTTETTTDALTSTTTTAAPPPATTLPQTGGVASPWSSLLAGCGGSLCPDRYFEPGFRPPLSVTIW
jgi:plastocyanin